VKIYASTQEHCGPQIRFVENIMLEYTQINSTINIFFLKEDASLAEKIIHTIYHFTEYDAEIFFENKKISIAKLSPVEIDNFNTGQFTLDYAIQHKLTASIKLSKAKFEYAATFILVAADNDAEAF
jgi:hypothetical protein